MRNKTIFLTKLIKEENFEPVVKKSGIRVSCPYVCKKEMDQNELEDHECSSSEAGEDEMDLGDGSSEDTVLENSSSAAASSSSTPSEENGLENLLTLHQTSPNNEGI